MAENSRARKRRRTVSPEEYAAFIDQVELLDIWMEEARVVNRVGPVQPERVDVRVASPPPSWEPLDGGFTTYLTFELPMTRPDKDGEEAASVTVTFGLRYESKQPMDEAMFDVFARENLPVNAWPYLREFVASMLTRMGWRPFTLPTLKRVPLDPGWMGSDQDP